MADMDTQKNVYLFLHGKIDLREKAINALTSKGFATDKITMASPNKVGEIGDYMAMLWRPPTPNQIKIQQITKVEEVEPEGMIGLWKGVSQDDIDSIPL
jgi:predicted metalloprotease